MGTRASIAFIDYDKATDKYLLFVSRQFNGDMAPDMDKGEKLIGYFRNIYLDKRNHEAKRHKMERIVSKMIDEFGYKSEVTFNCTPLNKAPDGTTYINLQTKYLNKKEKAIDYVHDLWSTWFDYSDYLYIVPICDVNDDIVVIDEKEDGTSSEHYLEKDYIDVYCFRKLVGTICPEDCVYVEHNLADNDEEVENNDEKEEILKKEPFGAAPPLNTNVLPQKRFVEILTQYKDGDRYCLVVRDSDNKHVIFKEMK